jgi:hypothetical protein
MIRKYHILNQRSSESLSRKSDVFDDIYVLWTSRGCPSDTDITTENIPNRKVT